MKPSTKRNKDDFKYFLALAFVTIAIIFLGVVMALYGA